MASEIRVNSITNRSGLGTVTFSDTGVVLSGVSTFTVSAGSASAPSISPSGDSNTGIFFPAADTIAFAEGGVEALRIDSNANIGIGTFGPTTKFEVGDVSGGVTRPDFSINTVSTASSITIGRLSSVGSDNTSFRIRDRVDRTILYTTVATVDIGQSDFSSTNLTIKNGNLVIGTAGKGIDFSATSQAAGMTSELLSDYEEGTFTITISGSVSGSGNVSGTGRYTKIGRLCYVFYRIDNQNFPTFSGQMRISLPFTAGGTANEVQMGSKIYFYPLANWDGVANCAGFIIAALPNTALAYFTIEILDSDRQNSLSNSNSSLSNSTGNYFSASLVYEVA